VNIDTLILQLVALGISMSVNGEQLELRPGSMVPEDLQSEVRRRKSDLIGRLTNQHIDDSELTELIRQVGEYGYVLLWSVVLRDAVAFVSSTEDAISVPRGFVIYTLDELVSLFSGDPVVEGSLRLIHQAKKLGSKITDVRDVTFREPSGEIEHE
jgi:hypothetical protein